MQSFLRSPRFWLALAVFVITNLAMIPRWREVRAVMENWERTPAYLYSDEVFVYRPAESVFNGGYFGYRCIFHSSNGGCYGGTQALLDGAYLKLFSRAGLEANPGFQPPGQWWPWIAKYPNVLSALRWQRFWISLLFPLCFAGVAIATRSVAPLYAGAIIAGSQANFSAWQGLKNDAAFLPWLMLFSWLFVRALEVPEPRRRLQRACVAIAIGVLGNSVRPVLLPVLPFALVVYAAYEWRRSSLIKALGGFTILAALSVAVHILVNPTILLYASEWTQNLINFFGIQNGVRFTAGRAVEAFFFGLPYVIPGVLAVAYLAWLRREGRTWEDLLAPHIVFPLCSGLGLDLLVFKSLRPAPQYYLPGGVLFALVWIELYRRHPLASERAKKVFTGLNLALLPLLFAMPHPVLFHVSFPWNFSLPASGQVLLDVNLRAPLREPLGPRITFFDSLTTPPAALARENSEALLVVPCWDPKDASAGPAAHAWAVLLEGRCKAPFASGAQAIETNVNGMPVGEMIAVKWGELRGAVLDATPVLDAAGLPPRLLENGNYSYPTWEYPFNLFQDTELTGRFRLGRALSRIEIPLWSRCRGEGTATLRVKLDGKTVAEETRSLDTNEAFDARLPGFLRGWLFLRRYIRRAFPVAPFLVEFHAPAGSTLELSLRFQGLAAETCGVSLSSIALP